MVSKQHVSSSKNDSPARLPKLRKYARKQPWTESEDVVLADLVKAHGIKRWSVISSIMKGRSAKQCRERWKHQLDPTINSAIWSAEEEWSLYLHHCIIGNKWTYLINFFPGRTDNSIKNHWNTQMKKRMGKYKQRLETAIRLCRNDEALFKKSVSANECKLVEKISKSLLYKESQGQNMDSRRKNIRKAMREFNSANTIKKDKDQVFCEHDSDVERRKSTETMIDGLINLDPPDYSKTALNQHLTPVFHKSSECYSQWSPQSNKANFTQVDKYHCHLNHTRPSEINSFLLNEHGINFTSNIQQIPADCKFMQAVALNFVVTPTGGSVRQLSDVQVDDNFFRLREIAAGYMNVRENSCIVEQRI